MLDADPEHLPHRMLSDFAIYNAEARARRRRAPARAACPVVPRDPATPGTCYGPLAAGAPPPASRSTLTGTLSLWAGAAAAPGASACRACARARLSAALLGCCAGAAEPAGRGGAAGHADVAGAAADVGGRGAGRRALRVRARAGRGRRVVRRPPAHRGGRGCARPQRPHPLHRGANSRTGRGPSVLHPLPTAGAASPASACLQRCCLSTVFKGRAGAAVCSQAGK